MINRTLLQEVKSRLFRQKVITIMGARQVGKSTFVEMLLDDFKNSHKIMRLNGDDADIQGYFEKPTATKLRILIGDYDILFIDEAQRIKDIGLVLKIMVDNFKNVQIIATGSSSFELSNKVNEPLTGRKFEYTLYPMTFNEMVADTHFIEEKRMLQQRMIFGAYPEIVTTPNDAEELLKWLAGSYLYKDILSLGDINKPVVLEKILKALALQVGNEVKYNEIAKLVGANSQTVEKYIDLLEKSFIIFKLPALAGNVRNEIKKGKKIYFYDNGIRNAVIGNFKKIDSRTDVGALFENYMISERVKLLNYQRKNVESYFWRTIQKQEIDYIEVDDQKFSAYEFKWNPKKRGKISKTFLKNYNVILDTVISSENYEDFVIK
ncbi:ATP-binding protein [bacterium]|nr:ATP-binding protein [bacterium]